MRCTGSGWRTKSSTPSIPRRVRRAGHRVREEILQSDDETMEKEIINEDSSLLSTIAILKGPQRDSARRKEVPCDAHG